MTKKISLFLVLLVMVTFSNCGTFINALSATKGLHGNDHSGFIYSNTSRSEAITESVGPKKGTACQSMILYLFAFGDASLPAAKAAGNIKVINHITYEKTRFLATPLTLMIGPYMRDCITVYGE